jgi:hypothetical protein
VRTSSFALACALLALSAVPSAAEIRIEDARIAAGELRITGRVSKGGEVVVLDEDISVRADRSGRFSFRVPYMPQRNCTVTLKAGADEREAVIASCGLTGPQGMKGDAGPAGPQGPKGDAGPAGPPGPAAAAAPVSIRPVKVEGCRAPYCEAVCDGGEMMISALCLRAGQPTFNRRESGETVVLCPGDSAGITAFCLRQQ